MAEKHSTEIEGVSVRVDVLDEGDVSVAFQQGAVSFSWDGLREVLDFAAKHGLGMQNPYVVEYDDTREAIEA